MITTIRPFRGIAGQTSVPGDKSITHRALLLGALATGTSRVSRFLDAGDCQATMNCLRALGVRIERTAPTVLRVEGRGLGGLHPPAHPLDCGRSGTLMRLMAGLLAGQRFPSVLTGDPQLLRRPMGRIIEPLRRMGALIDSADGQGAPPLEIAGGPLQGTIYNLPMASAQVKSCVLLAGLYAKGDTVVVEPAPSRDHTERMLRARGVPLLTQGLRHTVSGPIDHLAPLDTMVPGDFSSAAFLLAAGVLIPEADLRVMGVGLNPTRTGFLDVLRQMGADVSVTNLRDEGGEPVADLQARYHELTGVAIRGELAPRMIDEFPILALAATQAHGITSVREAAELRVKETDRISTLARELRRLGAHLEERPDGFDIEGPTPLRGVDVESHGDHRLAMTLVIAGLIASGETRVRGTECISDSFPGFIETFSQLTQGAVR